MFTVTVRRSWYSAANPFPNPHTCVYTPIMADNELIPWSEKYDTGVELIDSQHQELVNLTNELFKACKNPDTELSAVFKETMSHMVEYVRFHFAAEMELMERIKYPDIKNHKKQHDLLIKMILGTVSDHGVGKKFVPNYFVRTLRDWIFGHIAVFDKAFGVYIKEQKHKGMLTDKDING